MKDRPDPLEVTCGGAFIRSAIEAAVERSDKPPDNTEAPPLGSPATIFPAPKPTSIQFLSTPKPNENLLVAQ